jgi:small ligand-binding sensory domain FIST
MKWSNLAFAGICFFPFPTGADAGASNPCFSGRSSDSDEGNSQPARYTSVVALSHHKSNDGRILGIGFTNIDRPAIVNCVSADGCLLSAIAEVEVETNYSICVMVDGLPLYPTFHYDSAQAMAVQSRKIQAGRHVVQTRVLLPDFQGTLRSWAIHYTMYDK